MYQFLLNMYLMGRINEQYLEKQVAKGRITQKEKEMILATPRGED